MARTIDLEACRPKPVSTIAKTAVLRLLPLHGAVTQLGADEQRKLDAIHRLLAAHARDAVYDIRVITVPQASTSLFARTVLLISLPALRLLTAEELQALVAHEMGHEYVWTQYADARSRNDAKQLRELELACDTIAVRVLAEQAISPERLQTGIEKTLWYNRDRLGVALNENHYPSLKQRRRLIKRLSS